MLHYWLTVFLKTFWDSWAFTDRSPQGLAYWIIVFALTILGLFKRHGKGAVKHYWRTSSETLLIGVAAYALVFVGHFIVEPYHLQQDEIARRNQVTDRYNAIKQDYSSCNGMLHTADIRAGLLGNQVVAQQGVVNSQQGTIDSLQGTLSKQQAAVTTCVGDLAKAIIPEPLKKEMFVIDGGRKDSKKLSILLLTTNKAITPIHIIVACKQPSHNYSIQFANGSAFGGGIVRQDSSGAEIYLTFPTWAPDNPLVVSVEHDGVDLTPCTLRQL
jgi:hypothetical protein